MSGQEKSNDDLSMLVDGEAVTEVRAKNINGVS